MRQFFSVGVTVKDGKHADQDSGNPQRGRADRAIMSPRTNADSATPTSTPGSGMPRMPSTPPKAIMIGNVTGRSQMAGFPN
jgi:hypothetical protein